MLLLSYNEKIGNEKKYSAFNEPATTLNCYDTYTAERRKNRFHLYLLQRRDTQSKMLVLVKLA